MSKVLVVATSRKTRGGITAVVKAHEAGEQWKRFHCHWVQTHRDGSKWRKVLYLARGMADFIVRVPFYDIVHIHISQPTTIKRKFPFLRIAKRLGKKVIVHFHAFSVENTVAGKESDKYRRFFYDADRIIVLSEWWKRQLIETLSIPKDKVEVLYNPCPQVEENQCAKHKNILYAGTVNERKGYSDLIRAFAIIAPAHPEWTLGFAGNGEVEQGRRLAAELGVADRVEFLGWVSGDAKEKAFQEASVFCLPSYAEGFPMAVLDAWAYGLPVVTTPVGGLPDVAKAGENMLLFTPGDIYTLAIQLERMIVDERLRARIAEESERFANGLFSIGAVNKKLADIYASLADR